MHDLYLQVDSLESDKPGLVPWVVGLLALSTLVLCVSRDLSGIQNSIRSTAVATISAAKATNVRANIDGRDVMLSGTLSTDINRDAFVASIRSIDGVRVVQDEMKEFNPRDQAKLDRLKFQQAIEAIDASAVSFQPGRASLSLTSEATLLQVAQLLKSAPGHQLKISGHTDNSGNASNNLELSRMRAQSVADFLLARGVREDQILVQGYGHTRPQYDNNSAEGRAKNRRIEFVFIK